jgi:hypothetical protein
MNTQFSGQTQLCQFCNNLPSEGNITKGEKAHNGHGPGRLLAPKPTMSKPTAKPAPGPQQYGFAPGKSNFLGLACSCCPYWITNKPTPQPTAEPTASVSP